MTVWKVIGGADKGGIIVRSGQEVASEKLDARLATGALIEEVALAGERLRYQKISGGGPETGWVSTKIGQKDLVVRSTADSTNEGPPPNVYAISDLHTDHAVNMDLVRDMPGRPNDVVILAGDLSNDMEHVRQTFIIFLAKYRFVFYCPGNHDLWLRPKTGCKDSLEKQEALLSLCRELGVHTRPMNVGGGVFIVPILSWYEMGFDEDPDIVDSSVTPVEKTMTDFFSCKWPAGLSPMDDSVANHMDDLNGELPNTEGCDVVISFSHFLPRPELLPEKRYVFYPHLAKAVGSRALGRRVQRLRPHCHVFGHSHYGWDAEIDGVRYLQAAVAYPQERDTRGFALKLCEAEGADLPGETVQGGVKEPVLVYDARRHDFPRYRGFWSEYYSHHPRRPSDVRWMYRKPREKKSVGLALRRLVNEGKVVDDEAIEALLNEPVNAA